MYVLLYGQFMQALYYSSILVLDITWITTCNQVSMLGISVAYSNIPNNAYTVTFILPV